MMRPRRLILDRAELAGFAAAAGVVLPPGAVPEPPPGGGMRPPASIAVNLAVLARPVAAVRIEAVLAEQGQGLRAWYGLTEPLGASLRWVAGDRAELSLFEAADFGAELLRAVPEPSAGAARTVLAALNPAADDNLAGVVPLDALRAPDPRWFPWTPPESGLVARVRAGTRGTLHALVTGRAPDGSVLAGQLVWLLIGDHWTALTPEPGDHAPRVRNREVRLESVERADFPGRLAPMVTAILEAAHA